MSRKSGIPATPSFEATPMVLALVAALGFLFYAGFDNSAYPPLPKPPKASPTWYQDTLRELVQVNRDAERLYAAGEGDAAGTLVEKGEKLAVKVLSIPRPTLEATEAAADIDHLYGRMLAGNHNYGWARLQFQKNVVRWKYWKPQTPETERRLQQALAAIAECDKSIEKKR